MLDDTAIRPKHCQPGRTSAPTGAPAAALSLPHRPVLVLELVLQDAQGQGVVGCGFVGASGVGWVGCMRRCVVRGHVVHCDGCIVGESHVNVEPGRGATHIETRNNALWYCRCNSAQSSSAHVGACAVPQETQHVYLRAATCEMQHTGLQHTPLGRRHATSRSSLSCHGD